MKTLVALLVGLAVGSVGSLVTYRLAIGALCFPRCLWETTGSILDISCFMDCGGGP